MSNPLQSATNEELLVEVQRRIHCSGLPDKRMLFIGPPGCGKGTQAPVIKQANCVCHLATGDMLREAVDKKTEMGLKVKDIMESGGLVSDDIVIGCIKEALRDPSCGKGFILDGFPRTLEQAKALDTMLAESGTKLDVALKFEVPDSLLLDRVTGRLVHPASGRSYHVRNNPPKVAGKDDITGEDLIHRHDDNANALKTRLEKFHAATAPVADYYQAKGILAVINADQPMGKVTDDLHGAISGKPAAAKLL